MQLFSSERYFHVDLIKAGSLVLMKEKPNVPFMFGFKESNRISPRAKLHCCAATIRIRQVDNSFIFAEEKTIIPFVFAS